MLVSLNWLQNYVNINDISVEELAEKITKSGIEVDGIHKIAEESSQLVVGYVEACEQHPNADKLNLCQVNIGVETLQIICGAPNIKQGQHVIVAQPGAVLPGNKKIKKAKLRGIESNGMICSLQEIGIDEKYIPKEGADGIFVFPDEVKVGEDVQALLNLNDTVLEFDLTPNRADCLSMIGVAYEVAAILDRDITLPDETLETMEEKAEHLLSVEVENPEKNPYYGAFVIQNVKVKESPLWLKNYLMAVGVRPINNIVDITNYVLFEYGQPLHAFDYDQLGSESIVVRNAKEKEKLTTLDGKDRTLTSTDLVITNGHEPVALAGVMGGQNTEVSAETTTVLLEAAYFDAYTVRRTVNATGLRSEASSRYEKGVDPNRVTRAGRRACQLLTTYAEGEVFAGWVEFNQLNATNRTVHVDANRVNQRLGTQITHDEIRSILDKLRFSFKQNGNEFDVIIPTRRGDISMFEDMLEEIARIYGYDQLPFTLPQAASKAGALTERQRLMREMKRFLQGIGLSEACTYSLTEKSLVNKLTSPEVESKQPKPVRVAKPMTEDHHYLRLSLLPELLKSLRYNLARKQTDIALYELGTIFITDEDTLTKQPDEETRLSGVVTGHWLTHEWQQENKPVDFYVVKGVIEGLFKLLNIKVDFARFRHADLHPGRSAAIIVNEQTIGFLGQLHPQLEREMDLNETYVFDLNVEELAVVHKKTPSFKAIPKYPAIMRDVAFVLDKEIAAGEVQTLIQRVGAPLVKRVHVFDLYEGDNLPAGKKSIAYNLIYQDPDKTLKDDDIEASFQSIIHQVNDTFAAYVRS